MWLTKTNGEEQTLIKDLKSLSRRFCKVLRLRSSGWVHMSLSACLLRMKGPLLACMRVCVRVRVFALATHIRAIN